MRARNNGDLGRGFEVKLEDLGIPVGHGVLDG